MLSTAGAALRRAASLNSAVAAAAPRRSFASAGAAITVGADGTLRVPDHPVVPFIEARRPPPLPLSI